MSIIELKGKRIAVLGIGREGRATFEFLKKNKIKSDVLDVKSDKNYLNHLDNYDIIFRTPGFPRLHPKLLSAEKKGAAITSHTKLFFDLCPAKIIGITGTKGKTTTAFLIYNILKSKYPKKTFIAGNFGKPALDILPHLKKDSLVVLELSSFQLQDLYKSPFIAVITSISLDHMDPKKSQKSKVKSQNYEPSPASHQTPKEYFNAKINIIKRQGPQDFAVIHSSLKNKTKNIGRSRKIFPEARLPETRLRGRHNLENIALAVEVGKIFKVPVKNILKAVKNFKCIEHRLEFLGKVKGISFFNDSAATNPDATLAALKSFEEPIHLILGGSDKDLDYKNLTQYISKAKNIKTIALIGQLKEKLYRILKSKPGLEIKKLKSLKEAVLTLYKKADKNEVALLSPAAASFDMFQNYAERGDQFKKLVKQIRGRYAGSR